MAKIDKSTKKKRGQPPKDYTTRVVSERVKTDLYVIVKKEMKEFIKRLTQKNNGI